MYMTGVSVRVQQSGHILTVALSVYFTVLLGTQWEGGRYFAAQGDKPCL